MFGESILDQRHHEQKQAGEKQHEEVWGMVSNAELLEDKVQDVENEAQELCETETVQGCINYIKEYGSVLSSQATDGKD